MKAKTPLLVILANLTIALTLIWFFPSTGDYRCDNPFWNGFSKIEQSLQAKPLTDLGKLPINPTETALILIPYKPLDGQEMRILETYVVNGGVLILMDDYGYGNEVLQTLNIGLRFSKEPLLDPLFNYKSPQLPKAILFSRLLSGVQSIVMNHATALNVTGDAEVLAWSSSFSFQDLDRDLEWDPDEPKGRFPVAARAKLGNGWVIAVSDPSIMINSMVEMDDNSLFVRRLLELHKASEVFIDQSHLPTSRLEQAKGVLRTAYLYVSSPIGVLAVITLTLISCLSPLWLREVTVWRRS